MPTGVPGSRPICTVQNCDSLHKARGFCLKHYKAHRVATGEVTRPKASRKTPAKKVLICTHCGCTYLALRQSGYCSRSCRSRSDFLKRKEDGRLSVVSAEARRRYQRTYYLKNRDSILAKTTQYAKMNPQIPAANKAMRKSSKKGQIRGKDLSVKLRRNDGRCTYCQRMLSLGDKPCELSLNWDHIIPISRGGSGAIGNLTPSCRKCNLEKRSMFVMEWRVRGQWFSKIQ